MTLLFCTSGLSAPCTLSTPLIVFGKTRYVTHLRLFFSPPISRFLAAPDVTGEAQTVWPSHRDLHRDTQRRVGVFVFYSQCKSHRAYQRGGRRWDGSTCTAGSSPASRRGGSSIAFQIARYQSFAVLFPGPVASFPKFPPSSSSPSLLPLSNSSPKVDKIVPWFRSEPWKLFFFFCVANVTEVFCVILRLYLWGCCSHDFQIKTKHYIKATPFLKHWVLDKSNAACW